MTTQLPRRLVLRGFGGLAVALPLLEFNAKAWAATPPPPKFITFFEHGGTLSNYGNEIYEVGAFSDGSWKVQSRDGWRPKSTPSQPLRLGDIHQPLQEAGLTGDVVVVRGIDDNTAMKVGEYGTEHGTSNATVLTCSRVANPEEIKEKALASGPSLDQFIGSRWGAPAGGFATVNLMIDAHNYGTPFYRAARQQASRYFDAQKAFDALFVNTRFDATAPDPAIARAQLLRRSVLDGTSKELARFKNRLTAQDKRTIEAHLEHVRSIERRVAAAPPPVSATCSRPLLTKYNNIPTMAPLMVDIGLAALRCGVTRVLSLEIGDFHMTWDPTPIPFTVDYDIGHALGHMGNELGKQGPIYQQHPDWLVPWQECMIRNRQFRAKLVAKLLSGLKATPEGDTHMLDNSLFLWTSEFSYGGYHMGGDLPVVLAGRAGGLRTGRYLNYNTRAASDDFTLRYASSSTTNNLYTSCLNYLGFPDTGFGDMAFARVPGPLAGL